MADDITRGINAIAGITGERPRYFRPPQGLRVPTLRDAFLRIESPPVCVTWTVRGLDTVAHDSASIVKRIERALLPGAIVLLHDGSHFGHRRTPEHAVDALRALLTQTRTRNLKCVRLDELLEARN
jgi:peptidoglycan/xylan/chitin deacetylase (PgdA/CDA1 family)